MPKVGDHVKVTIKGPADLSGTLQVGRGAVIAMAGVIVRETIDAWIVELNISVAGKNELVVPKSVQIVPH
jgi:hypothetical protein